MHLSRDDYRSKVLGCWLGKNIGGTLGAPFEWHRQINDVTFYTQDLGGEPLPNDDLDIQLLWLVALEEKGIEINSHILADYWCLYVTPHWCEYGTGKINMRQGFLPPLSGNLNNEFKDSCGAFIRSEIWACIAPGRPDIAAKYAFEDAILDHGNGEGTYAEVFVAAMEAAAFVCSDLRKIIEIGLSYIPSTCGVAGAVHTAIASYDNGMTWLEARDEVLRHHRGGMFWGMPELVSQADHEKGFAEGQLGYDVPSNIGITVLGLLYGEGDFDKTMQITVNCGEDTDCTGATAGSIFGIIMGADAIPQRWIDPIGRKIKTACLNLGELGYFGNQLPQDVDDMTNRTERIACQVSLRNNGLSIWDNAPTDMSDVNPDAMKSPNQGANLYRAMNGPRFDFPFFSVAVDYGESPAMCDMQPKQVKLTIHNDYKIQANLSIHWYLPEGWSVCPSADVYAMSMPLMLDRKPVELYFEVTPLQLTRPVHRGVVEISIEGRPTIMTVPLTFLNGNAGQCNG